MCRIQAENLFKQAAISDLLIESLVSQRIIKATTWEPCAGNDNRVLEVLVLRSQEGGLRPAGANYSQ